MTLQKLKELDCYLEGHFKLSSGLHSDKYLQMAILQQTNEGMELIDRALVESDIDKKFKNIDIIIGAAYGGIIFSNQVMRIINSYNKNCKLKSVFCERVPEIDKSQLWNIKGGNFAFNGGQKIIKSGKFQLRRGFEIKKGEKVLIAEDVTTTGKSIGEVAELVKEHGGEIIGAISIIDRRKDKINKSFNFALNDEKNKLELHMIPFISLIQLDINTHEPNNCPLCKDNVPIIKPGSRK